MSTLNTQFLFQAMTPAGGKSFGVRAAPSEAQLAEELRRDQLLLLKAWRLPVGKSAPPGLGLRDEAALNDQLATLQSRGVPLVEALEVAASVVGAGARPKVMRLRELVAAGDSLSSACEKAGGFDAVIIAVYRAAERTGDVAGAARRLSTSARRRLAIRGKAITVMIYPAVVCVMAMLIFMGLLMFLVPTIAQQLTQMNSKPNAFSSAVFGLGIWMNGHKALVLGSLGAAAVGAIVLRSALARLALRGLARVPAVSSLLLTAEMTRFFSVMAAMVRSGVPLADALGTAAGVLSAPQLRAQLQGLQKGLVEGGLWRTLVERADALPLATRKLLVAAERAGDLDSAFDTLSGDMAAEVDTKAARLLALLEPGVILLMFALVGPLIIAIAIPLLTARTGGAG